MLLSSLFLLSTLTPSVFSLEELSLTLHGSGTTNPSKLLWHAGALFEEWSKIPLHLTYRAVGSSTGRAEFVEGVNDFAASELPLPEDVYNDFTQGGAVQVLHVPMALGTVSFFHSLPIPEGTDLNLTAAVAARLFTRNITSWSDQAVLDLNPALAASDTSALPEVTVVHRVFGSSSTYLTSEYLTAAAPEEWTLRSSSGASVAATLEWPEDTVGAEGSGGVTSVIQTVPGALGYIDSGHGLAYQLSEVAIQNADGNFLTSSQADVGSAADSAALPASPADSWHAVTLVHQAGEAAWPMTTFTYLLLNADQTFRDEVGDSVYGSHRNTPDTGALLKALVSFILSDRGQAMAADYAFVPVPERVAQLNNESLALITLDDDVQEFVFEWSTAAVSGAEERTLSAKRRSIFDVWNSELVSTTGQLQDRIAALEQALADALETIEMATTAPAPPPSSTPTPTASSTTPSTESPSTEPAPSDPTFSSGFATAALVLSLLALLGQVIVCVAVARWSSTPSLARASEPVPLTEVPSNNRRGGAGGRRYRHA
jgi:ABC-type phosphate transport system substrate-binding protein